MKFKVQWEEERFVVVEAKTSELAEEMVKKGYFDSEDVEAGELTSMPEAYELTE